MKNLLFILGFAPLLSFSQAQPQCISDVFYLEDSPQPCHFVGVVNFDDSECVDFFSPDWKYIWKIKGTDGGDLIATYDGMAFEHVFKKFGGYDFCLEIHKDGTTATPPDHIECVTYTTCEPCGETKIEREYLGCPIGEGCNLAFSTKIKAENMAGIKSEAKYVFTYHPTPQELLGGVEPYDIEFDDIAVEYHPDSGYIYVSEDLDAKFRRGCYTPRLELEMEYDAGAHHTYGGAPCTEIVIASEEVFRCIACNEGGFGCNGSIMATEFSNEEGTCELFGCPPDLGNRNAGFDTDHFSIFPDALRLSPNPAGQSVFVEIPDTGHDNMTLFLFDAFGKMVAEKKLLGMYSTDFDVSGFQPGMYLLTVWANGNVLSSEKLAIIR